LGIEHVEPNLSSSFTQINPEIVDAFCFALNLICRSRDLLNAQPVREAAPPKHEKGNNSRGLDAELGRSRALCVAKLRGLPKNRLISVATWSINRG
jgi:hypothetical protein